MSSGRHPKSLLQGFALVAVATIAVAGCSSSTGGTVSPPAGTAGHSSSAPAPTVSSSSSTAPAHRTGATVALSSIPVQLSEVPIGWTPTKPSSDSDDPNSDAHMAACTGIKDTSHDVVKHVETDYEQAGSQISSEVQRMRTQSDVRADVAMLRNPKASSCLKQAFRKQAAGSSGGVRLNSFSFHLSPGSHGGPANLAGTATLTATVSSQGMKLTVYLDLAFITGPRLEADLTFTGVGGHVDPALQRKLVALVAKRAAG